MALEYFTRWPKPVIRVIRKYRSYLKGAAIAHLHSAIDMLDALLILSLSSSSIYLPPLIAIFPLQWLQNFGVPEWHFYRRRQKDERERGKKHQQHLLGN